MKGCIEDRLMASLRLDAINGDAMERSIFQRQVREALEELVLRKAERDKFQHLAQHYGELIRKYVGQTLPINADGEREWNGKSAAVHLTEIPQRFHELVRDLDELSEQLALVKIMHRNDMRTAADSLELNRQLKTDISEALEALEPFAVASCKFPDASDDDAQCELVSNFRRAFRIVQKHQQSNA